jgi:hypothetical protein
MVGHAAVSLVGATRWHKRRKLVHVRPPTSVFTGTGIGAIERQCVIVRATRAAALGALTARSASMIDQQTIIIVLR